MRLYHSCVDRALGLRRGLLALVFVLVVSLRRVVEKGGEVAQAVVVGRIRIRLDAAQAHAALRRSMSRASDSILEERAHRQASLFVGRAGLVDLKGGEPERRVGDDGEHEGRDGGHAGELADVDGLECRRQAGLERLERDGAARGRQAAGST
jgi:hypothetical protein